MVSKVKVIPGPYDGIELAPCPYCGSTDLIYRTVPYDNHAEFMIACGNCGALGPNEVFERDAIHMWNLRRLSLEREKQINAGWTDVTLGLRAHLQREEDAVDALLTALANVLDDYGGFIPEDERQHYWEVFHKYEAAEGE